VFLLLNQANLANRFLKHQVRGLLLNQLYNLDNLLNLDNQPFGLLKHLESSLGNHLNPNGLDSLPRLPKVLGHQSEPLFLLDGLLFGLFHLAGLLEYQFPLVLLFLRTPSFLRPVFLREHTSLLELSSLKEQHSQLDLSLSLLALRSP
jgi:hypothetical protein